MELNNYKIMVQIARIIYGKHDPFMFITYMYQQYCRVLKRSFRYKLRPLNIDSVHALSQDVSVKKSLKKRILYDFNNTVFVNEQNVYPLDQILLLYQDNKSRHVYVLPSTFCKVDELLIPDTLLHNLQDFNTNGLFELRECSCDRISYTQEIVLSLVTSPTEISYSTIDSLLENYFTSPKIVYSDDIISISTAHFDAKDFFLNRKVNSLKYVHFKCTKAVSRGGFCLIGKTTVSQSVNVQSFLPKRSNKQLLNSLKSLRELSPYPSGLAGYYNEISKSVRLFFEKRVFREYIKLDPVFLIHGERGSGKKLLISTLASKLGVHFYEINNSELTANVYAQNETKLRNVFFTAKMSAPCLVYIGNFENFSKNNEGQFDERISSCFMDEIRRLFHNNTYPIIVFCSANEKLIAPELNRIFLQTFNVKAPSDEQREGILRWILDCMDVASLEDDEFKEIVGKTHGFLLEDLRTLVYYAEEKCNTENVKEIPFSNFLSAIDEMQANYNESLGAPKIPKVQWSDVGGLTDVKNEIIKTITLPLKHPNFLQKVGLKRTGILLFGPPGTGKTLIAKAVATECNLCFLSVKGPELLNMYVGQSEQNVRDVFEKARQASPCIIFFDELDSLAPNRGINGDSGGVMDRVVSQLLAEMDGLNKSASIFIIGATNRPDLIDPALLRPGRFDKLLFVGPCTDLHSKTSVLQALTRKFHLAEDVILEDIVKDCPTNVTGADFYGLCSNAWMSAVRRLINVSQSENSREIENLCSDDVVVRLSDFQYAVANVNPSVSVEDLRYFERLKKELASNE